MGELGAEFFDASQLELQSQELDEFQFDGLTIDIFVKVKNVDLYAELRAIVQRGSVSHIDHTLQSASAQMHQHSISTVVRQDETRVGLANVSSRETDAAPVVEAVNDDTL